jgi:hypothetical protein
MRGIAIAAIVLVMTARALAQPAPAEQSPRQKYDYWVRCAAMFQLKGREANQAGNTPETTIWETRARTAIDNGLKEAQGLNVERADAQKNASERAGQFSATLAQGNQETDAQFERAVDICTGSLNRGT